MPNSTLVAQIDLAQQYQSDKPQRIEAETSTMVDMSLAVAARAASQRLVQSTAAQAKGTEEVRQKLIFNFS
jgi:hypothetical protein